MTIRWVTVCVYDDSGITVCINDNCLVTVCINDSSVNYALLRLLVLNVVLTSRCWYCRTVHYVGPSNSMHIYCYLFNWWDHTFYTCNDSVYLCYFVT